MSRKTDAGRAVASVRDILSRRENLARIDARLSHGTARIDPLQENPHQPRKLLRPPLEGNLTSSRYTYPDGSSAIMQYHLPDPDNPNAPCRVRIWVETARKRQ